MSASDSRDDSFDVETNSPFYFNTSHWRAVDGILEGVRDRAGLMLLTGPTGSGKTMIMRAISEGLEESTPGLFLQYASLNFREFINFLHTSLRVEDEIMDAPNKAVALREFLYVQAKRDETGVVFIDEAHNLEPDVLKMLPKLARFDTLEDGRPVGLQFVLIASEDLREIMADTEYDEVRSKIAVDHTLRFFSRAELKQFLKKRLAPIARMTDEPITEGGIEEMGRFTGGSPRLIGMICSHAMLFAAENPGRSIDEKMVQEAAEALMLSPVENAFAEEDNNPVAPSGPFSEADLAGEQAGTASAPVTETVYAHDDPNTVDSSLRVDMESPDDGDGPLAGSATAEPDDSLYAADHAAIMSEDDAAVPEHGVDRDDDDAGFDDTGFDRSFDDDDDFDDDDLDDDFDDDLDDDESLTASGFEKKGPAVRKGGSTFLSRLGWRKPDAASMTAKIKGASRKKEKPAEAIVATRAERGPKTQVVGEREKKMKMAGIAAGIVAVLGLGYAVHEPVISIVGDVFSEGSQQLAAVVPSDVPTLSPTVAQPSIDRIPSMETADGSAPDNVTIDIENTQSATTGGWDARVVVSTQPALPLRDADMSPVIPDAVTGVAAGALNLVDRALGAAERTIKSDGVGGVLNAAAAQVAGIRDRVVKNGLTDEQILVKAGELVEAGNAHFANSHLIAPSGGNAYDSYREALSLDPRNIDAQAGITKLREHFAKKAEGARNARQWESANKFFETAIAISNLRAVN